MKNSLLVPVDFSKISSDVIVEAASLATATDLNILLLHVIVPTVVTSPYYLSSTDVAEEIQKRIAQAREKLEAHASTLRDKNLEVTIEIVEGAAVRSILAATENPQIRYIVIGSHGHGMVYDLLVGSTTNGVLRGAKIPVVIVPFKSR